MRTFKVEYVRNCWTVVAYAEDGRALGGDHHWLEERLAIKAKKLYEEYPMWHGKVSREVRKAICGTHVDLDNLDESNECYVCREEQ